MLELYSLDARVAGAHVRLRAAAARARRHCRRERADLSQALAVARRGNRIAQRQLATRLRLMYEQGDVEPLEIIFGSKSLDEALSSIDNLNRMTAQSEDVLRQIEAAARSLDGCRPRLARAQAAIGGRAARGAATADSLDRRRAPTRQAYISSLATKRRLNDAQISSLQAQASAAQVRSDALARPIGVAAPAATRVAAAPVAATSGGRTMTVTATGYSMPGTTATGLPVGWGVAAVDPSVIPLGTHMLIPGYGRRSPPTPAARSPARRSTSGSRRLPRRTPGAGASSRSSCARSY